MGLFSGWQESAKKIIGERAVSKTYEKTEANPDGFVRPTIDVLITDMMLYLRRQVFEPNVALGEIFQRVLNKTTDLLKTSNTVVLGFDVDHYVTTAKNPTQVKRTNDLIERNARNGIVVSPLLCSESHEEFFIPSRVVSNWDSLISSNDMRVHLYRFFLDCLRTNLVLKPDQKVYVAGANKTPSLLEAVADETAPGQDRYVVRHSFVSQLTGYYGEFDIGAVLFVEHFKGKNVCVDSIDGDMAPILLLTELRRVTIDPEDKITNVFLQSSGNAFINITMYMKAVFFSMRRRGIADCHIEHFVLALALPGTDFFSHFPMVGAEYTFETFFEFLALCSKPVQVISRDKESGLLFLNIPMFSLFIKTLFRGKVKGAGSSSSFREMAGYTKNEKIRASLLQMADPAKLLAYARLVEFTLNYWSLGAMHNGGGALYHLDALWHHENTLSVWGFSIKSDHVLPDLKRKRYSANTDAEMDHDSYLEVKTAIKKHMVVTSESVVSQSLLNSIMLNSSFYCCTHH
jgi:hypothetical protein